MAVFRGHNGEAYVVDAYCPHLGANLAVGGRVVGSCIECPFHGWQFQGSDGKCVRIPYAEKGTLKAVSKDFLFFLRKVYKNMDQYSHVVVYNLKTAQ